MTAPSSRNPKAASSNLARSILFGGFFKSARRRQQGSLPCVYYFFFLFWALEATAVAPWSERNGRQRRCACHRPGRPERHIPASQAFSTTWHSRATHILSLASRYSVPASHVCVRGAVQSIRLSRITTAHLKPTSYSPRTDIAMRILDHRAHNKCEFQLQLDSVAISIESALSQRCN